VQVFAIQYSGFVTLVASLWLVCIHYAFSFPVLDVPLEVVSASCSLDGNSVPCNVLIANLADRNPTSGTKE
jgi:hypothetical protein